MTLELAERNRVPILSESSVDAGKEQVCPVYPFGGRKRVKAGKKSRAAVVQRRKLAR
jgi:hypothetical protein